MTLTPDEWAWFVDAESRINETALALQNVAYMFSQLCSNQVAYAVGRPDFGLLSPYIVRTQRELAAVSLVERVLRGVERIA